ncbi:hypothetical protein M0805_001777 [Coniferiporia weirii]|nr:hypothetical protein M0805_001777 [Coniferiporia weirii]
MATPTLSAIASASAALLARASSAAAAEPADPTTPVYSDDLTWLTAYLTIHSLSRNSYVYMYILWFAVAAAFLALCAATWSGVRAAALGASWQRWALRRRTWRKKHTLRTAEAEARRKGLPSGSAHRQPTALPSNAQLLSAVALVTVVILLCFVGPDYINPDLDMFELSSSSSSLSKRTPVTEAILSEYIPHYTIAKSFWTAAGRTGGVAFALFPLVVMLALKAAPFALFAIPGLVGYSHDKMIRLHRYVGRLLWFVTTLHVVFWVVQACKDRRAGTGEMVIVYVWEYPKFRYAWVAYVAMTLLMLLSFDCIRVPHYEVFYFTHVILTPTCIVFAALHHPQHQLWTWCAAALSLWIGERTWRAIWWIYVNGIFSLGSAKGGGIVTLGRVSSRRAQHGRAALVQPYTYKPTRTGGRSPPAMGAGTHRAMLSASSAMTLTDPANTSMALDKKGVDASDDEEWEMGPLRSPTPNRPRSGSVFGSEGFGDRASMLSVDSAYSADSNAAASGPDRFGVRLVGDRDSASLTPTPGEQFEPPRPQASASGSLRGVPLHVQVPATTPAPPPPMYTSVYATQSPGAGPGPRTRAAAASAHLQSQSQARAVRAAPPPYAPPPGFAHATLLAGRTVRLRLVTPGYQTWAPGQHFLIALPAVSRLSTHPFSVASVCDEQAALRVEQSGRGRGDEERGRAQAQAEAGREIVLLIRAKKGWTKRLWELVSSLQERGEVLPPGETLPAGAPPPPRGTPGVVLRALVDGPFGSAARTHWGRYASVLVVAGGSGVSFGMSVLEYVCLCLAGRDGRFLGGHPGGWGVGKKGAWVTQRVRFVWLVREYAHIQWCAAAIRRCLQIVPTDALEINIFVTNFRPPKELQAHALGGPDFAMGARPGFGASESGLLQPPTRRFTTKAGAGLKTRRRASLALSDDSHMSDVSVDSIVDMYYLGLEDDMSGADGEGHGGAPGGRGVDAEGAGALGHETHVLDYTNFDGDDDTPLPGENRLSRRIIKESKLRRGRSRREERAFAAKMELADRVAAANAREAAGNARSPQTDDMYSPVSAGPSSSRRASTLSTEPLLSTYPSARGGSASLSISPISPPPVSPLTLSALSPGGLSNASLEPTVRWAAEPSIRGDTGESGGTSLALDTQEVHDLQVVSEWARPGKPKLGRILADEVEASKGRVAVACCGPTSLNALMRKLVAAQIDPARVARGDLRGSIDFIAEDFEY